MKIQWRGALHVFNRYQDIKKSLQQDAARFEFNIKCAEEQLHIQAGEIERLQKVFDMQGVPRLDRHGLTVYSLCNFRSKIPYTHMHKTPYSKATATLNLRDEVQFLGHLTRMDCHL